VDPGGNTDGAFAPSVRVESVLIGHAVLKPGDAVRLRPKARSDIMDILLAGRNASIVGLEKDADGNVHLAVVLPEETGGDLGIPQMADRRFFFRPDEVEPLAGI